MRGDGDVHLVCAVDIEGVGVICGWVPTRLSATDGVLLLEVKHGFTG